MERYLLSKRLDFLRSGGLVKRYHTKHVSKENTVAHHSFGVAWIVYLLHEPDIPSAQLLMAALSHDLAEQITGDISSPTKRKYPELAAMVQEMEGAILAEQGFYFEKSLNADEHRLLKMADYLDGAMFCISELELGNKSIYLVYKRYINYIEAMQPVGRERLVYNSVRMLWTEYEQGAV